MDGLGGSERMRELLASPTVALERRFVSTEVPVIAAGVAIPWNEWSHIYDKAGEFMEMFTPGAFDRSIAENASKLRVLYNHGRDPSIGLKPIARITELRDDGKGLRFQAEMLDADYAQQLVPALRADQLGASVAFRYEVIDSTAYPKPSFHNPVALPERVVRQATLHEFSLVTFPSYAGAKVTARAETARRYTRRRPTVVKQHHWNIPGVPPPKRREWAFN
jgi:HK97 family phage prohead protease